MKNIKIFATFCICLLLFSACSDDWKENALTARFSFDKSLYYVGDEVRITNETVGNPTALKSKRPRTYQFVKKTINGISDSDVQEIKDTYGEYWGL